MILDYLSEPNVITRVLTRGRRVRGGERDVTSEPDRKGLG